MSQEMRSQGTDDDDEELQEPDDQSETSNGAIAGADCENEADEDNDDIDDYYNCDAEEGAGDDEARDEVDPEYFSYELLRVEDAERLLNENVEALCQAIKVP